jgi:hypothetical protein
VATASVFIPELHTFHSPAYQGIVLEALDFFDKTPLHRLLPPTSVVGLGVYAIYYTGGFPPYATLAATHPAIPIYIGKAVPQGARTGNQNEAATKSVRGRLAEHARSIAAAENLDVADFQCRFMLLTGEEGDLIPGIESALIRRHLPLWNSVVAGFGIHAPGKGRSAQARSEWDTLHPGRGFAQGLTGEATTLEVITEKVKVALSPAIS